MLYSCEHNTSSEMAATKDSRAHLSAEISYVLQIEDACALGNQPVLASAARKLCSEGRQAAAVDGTHAPQTAHCRRSAPRTDEHLEEKR